jgi:hypothetical protein
MNNTKAINYYVSASGENRYNEISAKTLAGAKRIASKMYQKATGGRFAIYEQDTYANGEQDYREVAYWSGEDWEWHNAV